MTISDFGAAIWIIGTIVLLAFSITCALVLWEDDVEKKRAVGLMSVQEQYQRLEMISMLNGHVKEYHLKPEPRKEVVIYKEGPIYQGATELNIIGYKLSELRRVLSCRDIANMLEDIGKGENIKARSVKLEEALKN